MNETVYVYIVHSDINDNNIYAEFKTEAEAIDYAKRNIEELTYVDKVEVALDEDGDIIEEFNSKTIWVYNEEESFEETYRDDFFAFKDESPIIEALRLRNDAEHAEFFQLCREIGIEDWEDIDNFKKEVGCTDDNLLQALRKYRAELGPDFKIKEEIDFEGLVEALEENEDIVECKECFELFPKTDGIKVEHGYVCPHCHNMESSEFEIDSIPEVVIADDDFFKLDFPELDRMKYGNDMIPDEPNPEPMVEPCVGPECKAPVEAPITKDETITKLVVDEHEAIDGYEKAKIEIEANSELDDKEKEEILDTIEHIKEEEIEHIEELEELVDEVEETEVDEPTEESESEDEESEVLVEDDTLVDTRKRTRRNYADVDYNNVKQLDYIVARARKYNGEPRKLSAESLAWVFRDSTLKHLTNGLADCNSLEEVEKKLDPYFDYLPNSICNRGIEAYDEIVSVLPEALWELKTGIPVDKEGLDESLKSWDCWFDDEYLGTVEAKDEQSAYDKMCSTWPEHHYGLYDGVAQVIEAENIES